jgi:hypothetical protein
VTIRRLFGRTTDVLPRQRRRSVFSVSNDPIFLVARGARAAKPPRPMVVGRRGPGHRASTKRSACRCPQPVRTVPVPSDRPTQRGNCKSTCPSSVRRCEFQIAIGRCQHCGRRLQGRHPRQTSDALGAAAHQIGPQALALPMTGRRIASSQRLIIRRVLRMSCDAVTR